MSPYFEFYMALCAAILLGLSFSFLMNFWKIIAKVIEIYFIEKERFLDRVSAKPIAEFNRRQN